MGGSLTTLLGSFWMLDLDGQLNFVVLAWIVADGEIGRLRTSELPSLLVHLIILYRVYQLIDLLVHQLPFNSAVQGLG